MCGICGLVGKFKESEKRIYLKNMLSSLKHRGPDEEGTYFDEDLSFGIRRLSVIDLNTGSQPIFNEKKDIVIVCNGEIYNFRELREKLRSRHHFYTNSDTEVLIHLYEEYGTNLLKYIKGMYAFVLWDRDKRFLFMARDRFGIKPLYYYCQNGIFVFGSELKALLKLPFVSKELNKKALSLYFSLEYVPSPYSIYKKIYKLPPASYATLKNGKLIIRRYWNLSHTRIKDNLSFRDAVDKFKELFNNSVQEHLISDVPLGIFLSGGLDSSSLVAMAKGAKAQNISTFSIGFEEESFDESKYAKSISEYFGTDHYNYIFTCDDFINSFYKVMHSLDEPLADLSIFPTYMLSKFSRKYIKVALSGEGADELFMGYPTYIAHKYIDIFNKLPAALKYIIKRTAASLPVSFRYFSFDFKLKRFTEGVGQSEPALRHLSWMRTFSYRDKNMLFDKKGYLQELVNEDILNKYWQNLTGEVVSLDKYRLIQYLDIFTYLSEDLLVKADRASMLSSLEVRVPYLDHRLIEFVWSLKTRFIYQKRLLRGVMKDILPREIICRPKHGFPIPFSSWIRNKRFLKLFKVYFDKGFVERQKLFNYDYINLLLKDHLAGKRDNRKKLRTYIMFQSWFKDRFSF